VRMSSNTALNVHLGLNVLYAKMDTSNKMEHAIFVLILSIFVRSVRIVPFVLIATILNFRLLLTVLANARTVG
jgi:hypothetical protein